MNQENEGLKFYRCMLCSSIVSHWDIQEVNGCRKCGNVRIRPSDLSFWEKIYQIIKHPRIWQWKNMQS